MVPSLHSTTSRSSRGYCHASHNRAKDWNHCCAKVMGLDDDALSLWDSGPEASTDNTHQHGRLVQVTNLVPSELFHHDDDDDNNDESNYPTTDTVCGDPWMINTLNIQADLDRMAAWIRAKQWAFVSFEMDDAEASLIQSTVTSFAATTANDIESLRKLALSSGNTSTNNNNTTHHRHGIVQILLARLKEEIVEPFNMLQKYRSRPAVHLWQNPLQCKLLIHPKKQQPGSKKSNIDHALELLDDDDDDDHDNDRHTDRHHQQYRREQQFLPQRDAHHLRNKFMDAYRRDEIMTGFQLLRPKSLIREPIQVMSSLAGTNETVYHHKQEQQPKTMMATTNTNITSTSGCSIPGMPTHVYEELTEAAQEQMQQEAILLQAMVHGDLDSVQKMEHQMVSIATLLTQFSELVSEQSQEVWHIHDTAKETKDNMTKGQEELVTAAEQTHQSHHYMAKAIFVAGCVLLLFHWLRP